MKTGTCKSVAINQKETLADVLKKILKDFEAEDIHQFRLEIKKLKAAMHLLLSADKRFDSKKKYRPIRKLYKDLGAVRELQLQEDKFNDIGKKLKESFQEKYRQLLKAELAELQDLVFQHFDEAALAHLIKLQKYIKRKIKALTLEEVENYYKKRAQLLKKRLAKLDFSDKALHKIRFLIKEMKFNDHYSPKEVSKYFDKIGMDYNKIDDLQKWLGDWQDNAVLKDKLTKQESVLLLQNGENEALMQFKTTVEVENKIIRDKIKKIVGVE